MYYIHTISSITNQDSFRNEDVYASLREFDKEIDVVAPDYKEFIPRNSLRRLSPILRMGLTCAMECKNFLDKNFDAIVVGTALGCLKDTEKFLNTFITSTSDFLSPTAFIQSTHNTIGGQISLGLNNHAYNMTHTQNSLSFEVSMIDAFLCIKDGKKNVLVGAAEEKIDFLEKVQPSLIPNGYPLASGASFFAISGEKSKNKIGIQAVATNFNSINLENEIAQFLAKENCEMVDLILTSGDVVKNTTSKIESINYLKITGLHYSSSAFATHIAHDFLKNNDAETALIVNNLCKGKLGLILVKKG
ncbi:MAG: beta-ketoacyl synthase chain length factor [Fluviicola sp.]|nr:beta-ketoacyl synthase chain length factor [Fluviicola sp.]